MPLVTELQTGNGDSMPGGNPVIILSCVAIPQGQARETGIRRIAESAEYPLPGIGSDMPGMYGLGQDYEIGCRYGYCIRTDAV